MDNFKQQLQKMKTHPGFIAALDQSGGSTPGALRAYGIKDDAWSNEEQMFALVHQMRTRIITSPSFTGERILGAILFENTIDRDIEGQPTADYLWNVKRVVPFLKVDKGLAAEKNGVQLMKPMPELDALLARAKALGVFGTKERSVINSANREGIAAIVAQQVEVGLQVLASGLVPILEPEINIKSADRAESDQILLEELTKRLSAMPGSEKVMLKLSLPVKPGLFDSLVDHPRVLRVVALSGGYNRPEACAELAKNRGIVASFSRALLEDLRVQMSDEEFNASLASAIDDIYKGSTQKSGPVAAA